MESDKILDFLENNLDNECIEMLTKYNQGEYKILTILSQHDELTASELAERANVSNARMSIVVKSLIKKGYIKRVNHKLDKRKAIIQITESGKEAKKKGRECLIHFFNALEDKVQPSDIDGFINTAKALYAIIKEVNIRA